MDLLITKLPESTLLGGPAPYPCTGTYKVHSHSSSLASGYSLEQRKQKTGRAEDLERANIDPGEVEDDPLFGNILMYEAEFDDTLLAVVRSDLGVLWVECHLRRPLNPDPAFRKT